MKAIEFTSVVGADHTLAVPATAAASLAVGQPVRVLVLLADENADTEWNAAVAREFGLGYADSDAIYDQLSGG